MMASAVAAVAAPCCCCQVEVLLARHLPKKGGAFSTVDPQVQCYSKLRPWHELVIVLDMCWGVC
jgi:hypothetical protein